MQPGDQLTLQYILSLRQEDCYTQMLSYEIIFLYLF